MYQMDSQEQTPFGRSVDACKDAFWLIIFVLSISFMMKSVNEIVNVDIDTFN